jgi:hypothetical protein
MPPVDLEGRTFGGWTVVSYAGRRQSQQILWLCRCECGTERVVLGNNLKRGLTRSCGCLYREAGREATRQANTSHGYSGSATYKCWGHMKERCLNPNHKKYLDYGGRGITICERWLQFENFLEDMGEKPEGYSLDRINNEKGYEPGNCHWATLEEQDRNKRVNHLLTHNGETHCASEWAEIVGINRATLETRLNRGWSVEKALTTPVRRYALPELVG